VSLEPQVSTLLLRNVPLLSTLSEPQLLLLTRVVRRQAVARGVTVVASGDVATCLYVLLSGQAQVVLRAARKGEVILAILRPGDYFGEMALLDDRPRSASVVTREPCELLTLDKTDFARCLRENGGLAMAVARGLVARLRDADNRIANLALLDVYGRVAKLLMQIADDVSGAPTITTRLSKNDIAKMVGASRESVSRVINDLQKRGYLELNRNSIVLRSRSALLDYEPVIPRSALRRG